MREVATSVAAMYGARKHPADLYFDFLGMRLDIGFADGQRAEVVGQALSKDALLPQVLQRRVVAQSNLKGLLDDLKPA